ncbi:MAG TPA: nucleotidyl transferase AbiEii/AbiGii toxin family protein [Polyangiaceae bacterium]|nr:nucleotidyl transferase AbiEii/AbiGii toxin family protein [Polyangiaceae bacterium]
MTGLSPGRLAPLQRELLAAFFERERAFSLTGGAALVEFYLHHRDTKDLDLFARPGADIEQAELALADAALSLGATVTKLRDLKEFKRFLIGRGGESTLVDFVVDRAPRVDDDQFFGRIRVHSLREIAANKLCTILSRGEPRDLVDLMLILATGVDLPTAVKDAGQKDGGADPATLAWVLSEISVGPDAVLPATIAPSELERFRADLESRLRLLALPE